MTFQKKIVATVVFTFGLLSSSLAELALDDTWADGTRTDQNLPTESAWYASSGSSLTAAPGSMNLSMGGSAIMGITYFTPDANVPVSLNVGDTLQATITFAFSGVAAQNSSQGFRIGLFDFADSSLSPKRVSADLGSNNGQGNGVQGYALFQNMGVTFNNSNPMTILKRTTLSDSGLLGTSGDYTSLIAGPGSLGFFPGFANGTNYILQFTFQRTAVSTLAITVSWLNAGNGASLTTSTTDTGASNFNFDGIALRPSGNGSAASTITFKEAKVEVIRAATPPTIGTQPQDQSVMIGDDAAFNVLASGTAPLSYQWYVNASTPLPGATNSLLAVPNAQPSDSGDYSVLVSNAYGSVTSAVATLTVNLPVAPSIITQPQDQTVFQGQAAVFTVVAGGTAPLSYQWYYNTDTLLTNATDDTLTIPNVQASDIGSYSVVVSNDAGSVISADALLALNTNAVAPSFTTQPASLVAVVGSTAGFSATAVGTQPISYQWSKGGVAIPGATSATLNLTNIQPGDGGSYTITASNSVGSVTSDAATLTVTESIAGDIYVSPTGTDADPGTLAQPTSLPKAIATIEAGHTIWMRGGTYTYSAQITIARDNVGAGLASRKHIFAYVTPQGVIEKPVLDFSTQPYGKTSSVSNPRGIQLGGHYWHLRSLEVKGAADNGIYVSGNSNIVELCVTHNNRDTGLQLGRYSSTAARSEWPAGNLILNCDSYDNYDAPPNSGENADGFACKLTTGPGNMFRGCISHNNIDDGWDLYTKSETGPIDPVVIDQCISYNNGTLTSGTFSSAGDRNGFKLGGEKIAVIHTATRNIAFGNGKNGFTFNSNPAAIRVINNLAFDNVEGNFKFDTAGPLFYDNISLYTTGTGQNDRYGGNSGIATGPSNLFWFKGSSSRGPSINDQGLSVSTASFGTLTPPVGGFTRNADGSINLGNFGRLVAGSPLINAGQLPPADIVAELPFDAAAYYEGAPDIGPLEIYLLPHNSPSFQTQPVSQTVMVGTNVTFTVVANGSAPLSYQWFKNSQAVAGATNAMLLISNAQTGDAGLYSVVASNSLGTATSDVAMLNIRTAFQVWQSRYFGCTNCLQAALAADPDGDGMNNEAEFLSGANPTNNTSAFRIISALPQGDDVMITWSTVGGHTNVVQAATGGITGSFSTNFADISGLIIIPGSGDTTTNYLDGGGATNLPSRFYRVRLQQ